MQLSPEILETIQKVISLHAPKYRIPGYDTDDISQEAFLMAVECYKEWNPKIGPFENFLSKHLYFRLKNFVRDMTLNDSIYKDYRKQILSPLDISLISAEDENALVDKDNVIENVETDEILKKIDEFLPTSLRRDFLRMRAGVKIHRGRAKKIKEFVNTLLKSFLGEDDNEEYEVC